MPLLLVRHASAGDRESWQGNDCARPLDERGRRQAGSLVERLAIYEIERILSSPARRCLETVEPLAHAHALPIHVREELAEERQDTDGARLLRSLAGADVVVCGHGGLERALPDRPKWHKGDVLVVGSLLEVIESLPAPK